MSNSTPFESAIPASRPRGARVIEAFSPKLGRRLQCFGSRAFNQWICLEADPTVLTFCERPAYLDLAAGKRLADFWVRRQNQDLLLLIGNDVQIEPAMIGETEYRVQVVPPAEHAAARTWIANWERMLPVIISNRNLIPKSFSESVLKFVSEPMQLSRIEQEFGACDPTMVRAALFGLLHSGRLQAPLLKTAPLSYLTCFEPIGAP